MSFFNFNDMNCLNEFYQQLTKLSFLKETSNKYLDLVTVSF
jgi:hypothetical protein